uniref:Uncharacterized protein n=1 Tax=Arundo donax TaxID=35708 RepID=A0A0A9FV70_ARUDO
MLTDMNMLLQNCKYRNT